VIFARLCQCAVVHPTSYMLPWDHSSPNPKPHLDWFSRFCTAHSRKLLCFAMGRPFPPQNCPFPWGSEPPWFLAPTRVLNPNSTLIASAILAGLTTVTDRSTDHATRSVTIGRICVRSTAMQPNNISIVPKVVTSEMLAGGRM